MTNLADLGDSPPSDPASPGGRPGRRGSPHDSIFRKVFCLPESAASQLRAVLPPEVAGRLDLGRLKPAPGSFVDEDLTWRHTDLLFTAPATGGGQEAFVYVLMEHQRKDDPVGEALTSELRELAASLGPDAEEAYMTTAEMLHAEGKALSEAYWRGESLLQMLTVKFGALPKSVSKKIQGASSSQIKEWTARAVKAEKLDEVFGLADKA